jgi:hypothetical protein
MNNGGPLSMQSMMAQTGASIIQGNNLQQNNQGA